MFLTGVAFDDKDGDHFYDVGEQLGGLTLTAVSSTGATYTTTTYGSGGYDLALPPATYTVTFSGAGIETTSMQTTIGSKNVKLDLIDPATGRLRAATAFRTASTRVERDRRHCIRRDAQRYGQRRYDPGPRR